VLFISAGNLGAKVGRSRALPMRAGVLGAGHLVARAGFISVSAGPCSEKMCGLQSRQWVSGSWVMGQMGRQM